MPDEPEVQPAPEAPAEPEELRPWENVLADLNRHLETAPDEVREALRKHQVVSGLAGQIAQGLASRQVENERAQLAAEAARNREQELLRLAEEDPDAFAAQFRTEKQAEIARKELEEIRLDERRQLTEQLSRANASLPEWGELSPAEQSKVAKAIVNVPSAQVFAVYQAAVVDVIADRRAAKRTEAEWATRLAQEKEAWEAEQAAKRTKSTPAPNLRSGTAAQRDSDEPDFDTDREEWDRWYENNERLRKLAKRVGAGR